MAIAVRYFSDVAGPSADGTASTWAKREPLLVAGAFNPIIMTFDYTTDAMEVRIEGGKTYTLTTSMLTAGFTGTSAPNAANQVYLYGCDSSGNRLDPNEPDWNCCQGPYDYTGYPEIATTTNIATISATRVNLRCLNFTATARTAGIINGLVGVMNHCRAMSSFSNASTSIISVNSGGAVINSQLEFDPSVTAFINISSSTLDYFSNVRAVGASGASSGNRNGFVNSSGSILKSAGNLCVIGFPGNGISNTSTSANCGLVVANATVVNCGAGILTAAATVGTGLLIVNNSYVANCTVGVQAGEAVAILNNCRLRNTTDITGLADGPTGDNHFITSAGSDADEFVNAGAGDYRMKSTSTYWGRNMGAGDELVSPSGGGGTYNPFRSKIFGANKA